MLFSYLILTHPLPYAQDLLGFNKSHLTPTTLLPPQVTGEERDNILIDVPVLPAFPLESADSGAHSDFTEHDYGKPRELTVLMWERPPREDSQRVNNTKKTEVGKRGALYFNTVCVLYHTKLISQMLTKRRMQIVLLFNPEVKKQLLPKLSVSSSTICSHTGLPYSPQLPHVHQTSLQSTCPFCCLAFTDPVFPVRSICLPFTWQHYAFPLNS